MENEEMQPQPMMTYVVSAILVLVVLGGAWYFRSKSGPKNAMPVEQAQLVATPTLGPINSLVCDNQYFNQRVGFNEYYLSVEGGDVSDAKTVSCEFTAKVNDKVVVKATADGPLSSAPQRGGATFRCTSKAVEIEPNVLTTIEVKLTDDLKATSTCSADFTFPSP